MIYPASEKLEIIQLVEESHPSARLTHFYSQQMRKAS